MLLSAFVVLAAHMSSAAEFLNVPHFVATGEADDCMNIPENVTTATPTETACMVIILIIYL
jgi:hypothetical protein